MVNIQDNVQKLGRIWNSSLKLWINTWTRTTVKRDCIETSRMLLDVWIVSMKWSAPTRKITARTLACAVAVAKSSILYSKSKELNFILKMLCLRQSATRANNVCPCGRGRQKAESLILYSKCLPATISNGISALTLSSVNSQFYYSDTVQRAERMRVI